MKLRRAAAEFIVVLLGVLGALWVEDYRDWRSARSYERVALERIGTDLDSDIEELGLVATAARRRATGAVALILHLDGAAAREFVDMGWSTAVVDSAMAMTLPTAFAEARFSNDFDHANATYRELLATGRLETVRDEDLRRAIAEYYRLAEDLGDFTGPDRAVQDQLDGLYIENGIHPFLSDAELDSRLASDRRIEASLHRVARSARVYSFRMARLGESARSLRSRLGDQPRGGS